MDTELSIAGAKPTIFSGAIRTRIMFARTASIVALMARSRSPTRSNTSRAARRRCFQFPF